MTTLQAVFLGLVQGIAEFLPISSSGHLAIFQNLFGMTAAEEGNQLFDVLLHLGTMVSVFVVFWDDIVSIVRECVDLVRSIGHPVPGERKRYDSVRLLLMMFFATLPLFLVLPVREYIEKLAFSTAFVGIALIATGGMLYAADRMPQGNKTARTMRIRDALLIGLCQAVATIPGLSRSGTTITAGIATGLDRRFAVKFSFLISIPAVLGANLIELIHAVKDGVDWSLLPKYLLGMVVAMVVGYFALRLLRYIANRGKFGWFAYYCWGVGALAILLSIIL